MEKKNTLHDVPLFERLSPNEMRLVTNVSRTKRYKKNQIIFLEGEKYSGFYVVLNGSVKVYKLNGDGEEVVMRTLRPYRSFAESFLFSGSPFYTSCAQANEDSLLLHFPRAEFASLLGRNPALAIRISESFAVRLAQLNQRFDLLAASAEGRVARYLLNEIELNNSVKLPEPHFNLVVSKKNLAEHLGIASETLSRIFKRLKSDKCIREVSKKIFITDLKRLKDLTQA